MAGLPELLPLLSVHPGNNNALSSNNSWNTGAYANPSYKNNIFWLTVTYNFDTPLPPPARCRSRQRHRRRWRSAAAAPAAGAGPRAGTRPAGAEDHARLEGAVRLRQGGAEARGHGGDRQQVVGKLAQVQKLEVVLVTGHTDRIGTDAYNQKLSERRADAVRNYLVSKGVDKAKIETIGMGEKQPVGAVRSEEPEGADRLPAAEPPRGSPGQGRGEEVSHRTSPTGKAPPCVGLFFASPCATCNAPPRPPRAHGHRHGYGRRKSRAPDFPPPLATFRRVVAKRHSM